MKGAKGISIVEENPSPPLYETSLSKPGWRERERERERESNVLTKLVGQETSKVMGVDGGVAYTLGDKA